jgi:micrococcal nuclease
VRQKGYRPASDGDAVFRRPLEMIFERQTISKTFCLALLFIASFAYPEDFSGRVVGITDSDSISVLHASRAERIRLNGIDCPERRQPFGTRTKQFTSSLAFGEEVTVRGTGKDRYERTLAEVILPDGRNLNHELVKAGYAWWYRKYAPHDRDLEQLEAEARQAKLGLWRDPHPIPPWEYRKLRRSRTVSNFLH